MQLHPSPDPLDDIAAPEVRTVTTLVVGEDPLVRESVVSRVLGPASEAHSAEAAEAASRSGADVVLWDLGPSPSELDLGQVRFDGLGAPVIALAPADGKALPLLAAGASAVLRRDVSAEALRSAVSSVREGLRVVEPSLLDLRAHETPSSPDRGNDDLTPREHDVLELMAVGLSNKQIAAKLGISSHTAKFHIGAILAKLGAATRTEAVVRAVQRSIIVV